MADNSVEQDGGILAAVHKLVDRQAIHDCLTRYSRGVDRFDRELVLSCYHPEAIDDHGAFVGGPEQFTEWAIGLHTQAQRVTHHHITNHTCEIDGAEAHTETYFIFSAVNHDETTWLGGGRYLDRFEKRDGEWKIATRYCVVEWAGEMNPFATPFADIADVHVNGVPSRDSSDPSYRRPLTNGRALRFPKE